MGHYCIREMRYGAQERDVLAKLRSGYEISQALGSMNGSRIHAADYWVNSGEIEYALHLTNVNRSLNLIGEFALLRPRPPTIAAPGLPMRDESVKHLRVELVKLLQKQVEALELETYVGLTDAELREYYTRQDRIRDLKASLYPPSFGVPAAANRNR
jgi:hypothetical protein